MGPKIENVGFASVLQLLFEGSLKSSLGGMEGIKGERSEQHSDKAENHHQHGVDSGRFEVQKVRFLIKNVLCRHLELCFLCRRGAHFQKINKKMLPKCKKCG